MPMFRKKPVVIEARQFISASPFSEENCDLMEWIDGNGGDSHITTGEGATALFISTLEGEMRADLQDWIIRGVKGELYPCKPDIFAATYEPVND